MYSDQTRELIAATTFEAYEPPEDLLMKTTLGSHSFVVKPEVNDMESDCSTQSCVSRAGPNLCPSHWPGALSALSRASLTAAKGCAPFKTLTTFTLEEFGW